MSTAIHYTSIKPPAGREHEVFGLQVAISDWLKAYFRYSSAEKISFLIGAENEWQEIQEIAAQAGIDAKRLVALDRRFPEQNLPQFSTIFRPEPDNRHIFWQREMTGKFNFCGLAHAISGIEAGEVLQEYCLAPSQPTDAIVCPSRAVQSAIRAFWDHYGDHLRLRFGTSYQCPVQLPIIPLGIDCEKFIAKNRADKRFSQREKLGIADNENVLLWVGRLSAAIKAHPLAMFQAAERAAEITGEPVHLVMVGYFVPQEAEQQFQKLAQAICVKAKVTFVAANDPRFPEGLWAAGDIFLSLVDSIQESFGLTPIEAMAAGLPRVVSDWNGYRDSVTDGEDGFLIRTSQPPTTSGFELTAQVMNGREVYGGFLAKTALTVAVDAEQAADRISQLITNKALRLSMVENALVRARATYDWKNIIPQYEVLWAELAEKREKSALPRPPRHRSALPQLPDPYTMYAAYPSHRLSESDKISLAMTIEQTHTLWQHDINTYANDVLISSQAIVALLTALHQKGEITILSILAANPALSPAKLWRTIAWLQKLGIVKNSSCQDPL